MKRASTVEARPGNKIINENYALILNIYQINELKMLDTSYVINIRKWMSYKFEDTYIITILNDAESEIDMKNSTTNENTSERRR